MKVYEPILVAGEDAFSPVDIRVRVKGGGHTSQVYAIRQAIAKAVVAYYAKYIDAYSALELKKKLVAYDRTLLIADPRRMEPKKFGGQGARARRQKRYAPRGFFANTVLRFFRLVIVEHSYRTLHRCYATLPLCVCKIMIGIAHVLEFLQTRDQTDQNCD